jgi:hypothetical protein
MEEADKACLNGLGWTRANASKYEGAPGAFRGLEENAVVPRMGAPEQVRSGVPGGPAASSSRVLQCRRDWIERGDWRQHLDDYSACLAR